MGVTHLFFADDLMLFGEATEGQIRRIMDCMNEFSADSGLCINLSKSLIFCSPNTLNRDKKRIGEVSGIPVTDKLGKYLGIPILQKRVSKDTFGYILEGMKRKLANWKTGSLSLAGRRVLVQSALSTIPVYTMQAFALPSGTCKAIDKVCRDFLWGDIEDHKKVHLVNWDEVCTPKNCGRLGIRKAEDFNQALLAKLAWQMTTNTSKPWVRVMEEKYVKRE